MLAIALEKPLSSLTWNISPIILVEVSRYLC